MPTFFLLHLKSLMSTSFAATSSCALFFCLNHYFVRDCFIIETMPVIDLKHGFRIFSILTFFCAFFVLNICWANKWVQNLLFSNIKSVIRSKLIGNILRNIRQSVYFFRHIDFQNDFFFAMIANKVENKWVSRIVNNGLSCTAHECSVKLAELNYVTIQNTAHSI